MSSTQNPDMQELEDVLGPTEIWPEGGWTAAFQRLVKPSDYSLRVIDNSPLSEEERAAIDQIKAELEKKN